ncbi:sulfotransferase family 2 domain-containing protein [Paracoccus albus]|uniref:sulfotransferase family 2 domain-containing protein n=1 Tax=Paracoccus albus TaxID=3017784 RepID=UPI0022F0C03E|nr:sulfotransferase family 2 domain-containing protein [Paracoccus albus]WBU59762.1 sulfotransferase family 2 domain-containing protein [Paracoccus albus]
MRHVLVHYHIYKNSGTSFENVLDASFGAKHERFDGPYPFFTINQDQLDQIIERRKDAIAFSTHQALLPQPSSTNFRVVAAMFLRHPILRLGSIYRYKRGSGDGTLTARLATKHGFAGWIEESFSHPTELTQISNPQTRYLAGVYGRQAIVDVRNDLLNYDLVTAKRNLSNVEMLGRTEFFDGDIHRFAKIAAGFGIRLRIPENCHHNATDVSTEPVDLRAEALLSKLPPTVRARLLAANRQDFELYGLARDLIETRQT